MSDNKLSYDDLKTLCSQLQEQNEAFKGQLSNLMGEYQKAMEMVMGKRLDALLKVIEFKESFSPEFVAETISTIEEMLKIPAASEDKVLS